MKAATPVTTTAPTLAERCYEATGKARVLESFFQLAPRGVEGVNVFDSGPPERATFEDLCRGLEAIARDIRETLDAVNPECGGGVGAQAEAASR